MTTLPWATAITVNCRNHRDTIECVESLLKQDYPNFHIFVLDNGSTTLRSSGSGDGGGSVMIFSLPLMEQGNSLLSEGSSFKSGENLGFAGGNNLVCQFRCVRVLCISGS